MNRIKTLLDLFCRVRHPIPFLDWQTRRTIKGQEREAGDDTNEHLLGEYRGSEASESTVDHENEDGYEEEEEEVEEEPEKPWETLTGARAKAKVKLFQERHWAVTEIFYDNLAAATARLEATRTAERG